MTASATPPPQWLRTGREIFPAMLDAIHAAHKSVRLEAYICTDGKIGRQFRDALIRAARRGVRVTVLVDALGCWLLSDDFFAPLIAAGGNVRRFNPLRLWRFGVRDHRKLLVCDGRTAFAGGFNLADEYDGDGVNSGWCDLGVRIENSKLITELAASFDELFAIADFRSQPLLRLRAFKRRRKSRVLPAGRPLWSRPGLDMRDEFQSLRAAVQTSPAGVRRRPQPEAPTPAPLAQAFALDASLTRHKSDNYKAGATPEDAPTPPPARPFDWGSLAKAR